MLVRIEEGVTFVPDTGWDVVLLIDEDLGTISPHPLTESLEMNTGESTAATVSYDDEFARDVSENNSFLIVIPPLEWDING